MTPSGKDRCPLSTKTEVKQLCEKFQQRAAELFCPEAKKGERETTFSKFGYHAITSMLDLIFPENSSSQKHVESDVLRCFAK